ncbi:hypothetical protein XU18_2974 [Perkinsela sp. CCAP 1560/4]|nr:hypothetical protein XU18_2974 [Perkinsela sp. CCAP 1560/4]|eukprot:KNH06149.1 hypothetical protein XU18_2974 [Perkinsela sp. CCAP 1560/4]
MRIRVERHVQFSNCAIKTKTKQNVFTFSHISLKRIYEIRIALLEAVDSSFGRLDYASLSQQALMEMVIEGIANKEKICGDPDEPTDIEEWKGVIIEDGEVVEIAWRQFRLRGALHLEWLPSSVRKVIVRWNYLTANPMKGHLSVVGWTSTPALGEVRETAKLLPRGESPWWRDEGRHLLILCLFSIRGMRLAHMNNAKSREHAHTRLKARAISKLRYKNKNKKQLSHWYA